MFAEPWQPRFDRRWLELGCHHACRHSGVVNLDNRRQISFNSIADNQIHGFRFLWGLRVAAGELVGATVEFATAVPAGLETGNANVGPGETDGVTDVRVSRSQPGSDRAA